MRYDYVADVIKARHDAVETVLRSGVGKGMDLAVYDPLCTKFPHITEKNGVTTIDVGFTYEWLTPGSKPTRQERCVVYLLSQYRQPVMATMRGEWDADGREVTA